MLRSRKSKLLSVLFAGLLIFCGFQAYTHLLAQGPGGPNAPDLELVEEFDADENGRLDSSEREKAQQWMASNNRGRRGGPGGRGGPPGRGPGGGRGNTQGTEGPEVSPDEVEFFPDAKLYDTSVLRTIFLDFENPEWEAELEVFKPTDVDVPARMTVDGKVYEGVGVSFRGASSFFMIPAGSKRSLNLSVDFMNEDQRLYGYKTLNLLNCNGDASMMSSFLYSKIAGAKIATPKVNFVKVVINGRSWGIYANAQQFNKDFLKENYDSKKGARWKVSGNPNADGGLRYLGEDTELYRQRFDIKSKDEEKAWQDLKALCKLLDETPTDELDTVLEPVLDLEGTLWFLAADVALVNSDGYWTRASDYSIYQNKKGKFHIIPHDMNESFSGGHGGGPGGRGPRGGPNDIDAIMDFLFGDPEGGPPQRGGRGPGGPEGGFGGPGGGPGGPGGGFFGGRGGPGGPGGPGRGPGGGGVTLDPMVGVDNDRMPLRSRLLENERLRAKYLAYVKEIASEHLSWDKIGPSIAAARALISEEVAADTRKLMSYEAFLQATDPEGGELRKFCEERSKFLLNYQADE